MQVNERTRTEKKKTRSFFFLLQQQQLSMPNDRTLTNGAVLYKELLLWEVCILSNNLSLQAEKNVDKLTY